MPRIPAAIAVVMLVATCIGFNTARFPVVLEMAAVPEMSSQPRVLVCSATPTDSAESKLGEDESSAGDEGDDQGSSYGKQHQPKNS